MRRKLMRALRAAGIALAVVACGVGGWALFWTLYNPAIEPAPPLVLRRAPAIRGEATVLLAGDFAPTDAAMPTIRTRGYEHLYLPTGHLLRDADVSFVNLEAPVTDSDLRFFLWRKYLYRVEPAAVAAWRGLGLDLVSLANNHLRDYRDRGVLDTLRHVGRAGIATVGAGADERSARRPVIFDVGGIRVGFLAYLEHTAAFNFYIRAYAIGDRVGCAQLNRADLERDIRRLRPLVDVLIVSVHWGRNYAPVTSTQQYYGRLMADLGVDVVAGHHPHDIQPVEVRGRSLIIYSLGNYAWGTPGHAQMRLGLLARLYLRKSSAGRRARIDAVELLPIVTQNAIVRFQPRLMRHDERRWLDGFLAATRARKTRVELDGTIVKVRL